MSTILLIDASCLLRQNLKDLLNRQFPDLYVAEARSGEEALEILDPLQPDIILLNLVFPEGFGLHLTRQLRMCLTTAIFIVFIEPDSPEYRKMAYAAGADHILLKKFCCHEDVDEDVLMLIESLI